jgi:X-linked retinitis pigmentosa GTPase regulator
MRETTSSVVVGEGEGRGDDDGEEGRGDDDGEERGEDEGTGRSGGRRPLEAEKGAKAGEEEREREGEEAGPAAEAEVEVEEGGGGGGTWRAPTRSEASTS